MTAHGKIILGDNQYGKAECRLVRITRGPESGVGRHEIEDLSVTSQLRGDFTAAHIEGDNGRVVATDTQKNTVYAFAKDGVGAPEDFLLRLGKHFVTDFDWVTGGRWAAEQYSWERIPVAGKAHDHAFVKAGTETRTAVVVVDAGQPVVIAGLSDLVVLKSTGSEFTGFPRDKYTTLEETTDRILATSVSSRWRYNTTEIDYNAVYDSVRVLLLEGFASTHSFALQQTLYRMGEAVLEEHPEIDEIKFSMPNKHHFLVDLEPFGLENNNEVFFAADRPYGLIEAVVKREDASQDHGAWAGIAGFC